MKRIKLYLINITLTLTIIFLLLYLSSIYPFGNNILGDSDAVTQFKPMLYDFIMKIKTGTLLNYSFSIGLGNPFVFNYLYYLSSPINLFALLFNNPHSMFLTILIIKNIIASITMTYYVKRKTNNPYIIIIATLSYVFCSWNIVFRYFYIYLDIFMIFPLFQYGLEQLLDKHKYHLYIFTLSYIIITNFYLSFSIGVYTLLYFLIYEILYKRDTKRNKLLTFDYITLSTIASCMLSFVYLYILYDCILKMKIPIGGAIDTDYHTGIIELMKSIFYGINSFSPQLYGNVFPHYACPTIILISSIFFFFNKKIERRKRIFALLTIILSFLIVCIPKLDYIVNGFHNVRGFPFRYSFIFSFLIINLYINNHNNDMINRKHIHIIFLLLLITNIILYIKDLSDVYLFFSILFIIIYYILFILYENNHLNKCLIILVIIIQILVINYKYLNTKPIEQNLNQYKYNTNIVKHRLNIEKEIERTEYEGNNYYTNTRTTYFFTSMTYNKVIYIYSQLGGNTYPTAGIIHNSNELASLLFNVKNPNNNYYLEKIYSVNRNILNTEFNEFNIKSNLESLISNMTNIDDIFKKRILKASIKDNKYIYKTKNNFYLIDIEEKDGNIGNMAREYKEFSQSIKYGKDTATIYVLKKDKLKDIYNYLSKNQIKYTYYNDNHIKGTINVDKDQLIFTSIPYDKDWEVKIDDKIVKPIILLDSLMGIEVEPGKHTIEFTYKTHYLIPALISISTFIILLIDIFRKTKTTRK